jgi:hypothetical protein
MFDKNLTDLMMLNHLSGNDNMNEPLMDMAAIDFLSRDRRKDKDMGFDSGLADLTVLDYLSRNKRH